MSPDGGAAEHAATNLLLPAATRTQHALMYRLARKRALAACADEARALLGERRRGADEL